MKKIGKILFLVLAATLMLVLLCGCGRKGKVDGISYITYESKYAVVTSVDEGVTNAVIQPEFKGCPVTQIGAMAFANSDVEYVTIPESVTEIRQDAFRNSALKEIVIPESVEYIESYVFRWCWQLESVTLPSGLKEICSLAFAESSISRIALPEGLIVIGESAFSGCVNLKEIEFPESLAKIEYGAFSGCTALESVELPSALEDLFDSAFENCTALKTALIPDSIYDLFDGTFSGCTALESVKFYASAEENQKQVGIYEPFSGCTALKTVELPQYVSFHDEQPEYVCFIVQSSDCIYDGLNYTFADGMEAETVGLWAAIQSGLLSCDIHASSIDSNRIDLENVSDKVLILDSTEDIPAGLYLYCGDGSAQNLLVTGANYSYVPELLDPGDECELYVFTCCMNLHRDIPGGSQAYSLAYLEADSPLIKLTEMFEQNDCDYAVRQAAVWIVTDNAVHDDMEILTGSTTVNGITTHYQIIGWSEYIEAEQLVEQVVSQ